MDQLSRNMTDAAAPGGDAFIDPVCGMTVPESSTVPPAGVDGLT